MTEENALSASYVHSSLNLSANHASTSEQKSPDNQSSSNDWTLSPLTYLRLQECYGTDCCIVCKGKMVSVLSCSEDRDFYQDSKLWCEAISCKNNHWSLWGSHRMHPQELFDFFAIGNRLIEVYPILFHLEPSSNCCTLCSESLQTFHPLYWHDLCLS